MKIGFIITFAVHLDAVKDHVSKFTTVLLLGIHALIPIGLVMATGDDGSALIFMLMFLGMMFGRWGALGLFCRWVCRGCSGLPRHLGAGG